MKTSLLPLFAVFLCSTAFAQPCDTLNIGTKTLYHYQPVPGAKLPTGYVPVFINHVGRHGSRHLTKPVNTAYGYQLLLKADSANALTAEGVHLLKLLRELDIVEKPFVKSISARGEQEQQEIAERLYKQNKEIFEQKPLRWEAMITKEIRTKQTATAFIKELQKLTTESDSIKYVVNDTVLRFYDLSPAYAQFEKTGSWQKNLEALRNKEGFNKAVNGVCQRLVQAGFSDKLSQDEKTELITDLYGFYTILPSLKKEISDKGVMLQPDSIAQFFTCKQLDVLSKSDQAEDFFVKGPGISKSSIQVNIAAPLLADFLNSTKAFIETGKTPLVLRFSHAETIIPFAALLNIAGADQPVLRPLLFQYHSVWDAAAIAPLSANIQWILYQNKSTGKYLVQCLLNEIPVPIKGLPLLQYPYYHWENLRDFYQKKLQELHLPLDGNFYQYLQQLQ